MSLLNVVIHKSKALLIAALLCTTFAFQAHSQFNIGAGMTYVERGNEVGIGAKAFLGLNQFWGASLGANWILTNDIKYDINADAHYRLNLGEVRIHPLGGLNFSKLTDISGLDIGINLGVFSFIPLQERLNLYIEPKITLGNYNSFVLSAGVML